MAEWRPSRREAARLGGVASVLVPALGPKAVQAEGKAGRDVKMFVAMSLDGFIAGPQGELDWLPGPDDGVEDTFTPFMATVGAMLMGRKTFDVVSAMGPDMWAYGDTPVLVATSKPLNTTRSTVRTVNGDVAAMIRAARAAASARGGGHVYVDGGTLCRAVLDAGLVDEITVTVVPRVLGAGVPLFATATRQHSLQLLRTHDLGAGLVQLVYRTAKPAQ